MEVKLYFIRSIIEVGTLKPTNMEVKLYFIRSIIEVGTLKLIEKRIDH